MNVEQKEMLRLTLMSFETNSTHVRGIRKEGRNNLTIKEMESLLNVEMKLDEVKSAILNIMAKDEELYTKRIIRASNSFLHDNVN